MYTLSSSPQHAPSLLSLICPHHCPRLPWSSSRTTSSRLPWSSSRTTSYTSVCPLKTLDQCLIAVAPHYIASVKTAQKTLFPRNFWAAPSQWPLSCLVCDRCLPMAIYATYIEHFLSIRCVEIIRSFGSLNCCHRHVKTDPTSETLYDHTKVYSF
jgi:hypothetical protein